MCILAGNLLYLYGVQFWLKLHHPSISRLASQEHCAWHCVTAHIHHGFTHWAVHFNGRTAHSHKKMRSRLKASLRSEGMESTKRTWVVLIWQVLLCWPRVRPWHMKKTSSSSSANTHWRTSQVEIEVTRLMACSQFSKLWKHQVPGKLSSVKHYWHYLNLFSRSLECLEPSQTVNSLYTGDECQCSHVVCYLEFYPDLGLGIVFKIVDQGSTDLSYSAVYHFWLL